MKIKLVLFTLLLAVIAVNTKAQDYDSIREDANRKLKNFIGFGAGFTTGVGFSYRYIPGKVGFQATIGPYYTNYGDDAMISFGFTFLKKIVDNRTSNLYFYLGNHYLYESSKETYSSYPYPYPSPPVIEEKTYIDETWNTGAGIDFEFVSTKRVVMNIMVGYAQYNAFERLLPTIDAALYYKF